MKPYICALLVAIGLSAAPASGEDAGAPKTVFVIPIHGMIERGLLYVVRRGLAQAVRENVKTIIFDMNTPGGRLDTTEELIRLLIDLPKDMKTVTYVNKDALSAGALIALATDEIYMAPGSRIGASAPISMFGDIKEGDLKEKVVAATVALVSSAAQMKGHDEKLVEAMIRKESEYKIGDEMISPAGHLLVLTNMDAARRVGEGDGHPLLSLGTIETMDGLRAQLGVADLQVREITTSGAETLARYIEVFSILFLVGGLIGIYIEVKTPGFGLPGTLGILLLAIFFWGHNVAGLSGMAEIVLFVLGVLLLMLEVFVIPGFGVVGASGIALIVASILMAMIEHSPGLPWYRPPLHQVSDAITVLGVSSILAVGLMIALAYVLPHTSLFRRLTMPAVSGGHVELSEDKRAEVIVGRTGAAVTPLRPAGMAELGGKRIDVVAEGDFIDKGAQIEVAEVHGNRIVVRARG